MGKYKLVYISIILITGIILSCNLPTPGKQIPQGALNTVESIATVEIPTLAQSITEAVPDLSMAATMLAQTAQVSISTQENEPNLPSMVQHTLIPAEPGKAKQTIADFNSQPFADQQRTNGDYYDINLLERPFDTKMAYHGDIDIQKAEVYSDDNFYYFTIYLADLSQAAVSKTVYGVELDTDLDGRGDYLAWVSMPKSNTWDTSEVTLYADSDNDVGGKTALKSDAPSSGNGYEKILASSQDNTDIDALWSRKLSSNPNVIQIAIKNTSVNKPSSLMWSVWADGLLKSPNMFDYNDVFTLQNAGSVLKDDKNYPLKSVNTLDNTCRGLLGRPATGTEPGLCGDVNQPIKTLFPTGLPQITPPEIRIP